MMMTGLREGSAVAAVQSANLEEGDGRLLQELVASLSSRVKAGAHLIPGHADDRPDLIFIDPKFGVVAFEIAADSGDRTDRESYRSLNRKSKSLLATTPALKRITLHKVVVLGQCPDRLRGEPGTPGSNIHVLGRGDLADSVWLKSLATSDQTKERPTSVTVQAIARDLAPAFVFESRVRRGAPDEGAADRAALRIQLDAAQQDIASRTVTDVMVLTGPPGSGKTLVLVARARWLARQHPEWAIQILCYNNALVGYLKALVSEHRNIRVDTFRRWAGQFGVQIPDSGPLAKRNLAKARQLGIGPTLDALLIDEVQDFTPEWLSFALESVRPAAGGSLLAGDSAQALYRIGDTMGPAIAGRNVERVELERPYRSTRQILRVAAALDPNSAVVGVESALEGQPVDLIWAPSWDEQAAAVAWEIKQMIDSGDRDPDDIGILVTQRPSTITRLVTALEDKGIRHTLVTRESAAEYDPTLPGVKVMTVHAAKGHEFPVVFLFGLEALPDPDADDVVAVRRGRVGFTGMTRAKDQLLMTYSKDNAYLVRLKGLDDDLRQWTWPDEYEV